MRVVNIIFFLEAMPDRCVVFMPGSLPEISCVKGESDLGVGISFNLLFMLGKRINK